MFFMVAVNVLTSFVYAQTATDNKDQSSTETEKEAESKPKTELNLNLNIRDGICRVSSPIMLDVVFENRSMQPQKLCTYNFYESLLKVIVFDAKGDKVQFNPKLITAGKVSKDDWVEIPPGRAYKRTFSLNRKVIDATGYRLGPGNYRVKVAYEGCSKFDATLPSIKIESNLLYLLVTE